MYEAQANPIIEYTPGMALDDLTVHITPLTTCVGLLVTNSNERADCRTVMQRLPVPCVAVAFLSHATLRRKQRIVSGIALTQQHGCLCRVFESDEEARLWLQVRIAGNIF
jgi:hypothetical protein